ncbi:hypothetical protein B0H14DRAFT_3770507 [Mycena olivaceomarginata]|nr:hypothetical protein B0H14DRAFT_3770507 [Mycena olivaceomarginata]
MPYGPGLRKGDENTGDRDTGYGMMRKAMAHAQCIACYRAYELLFPAYQNLPTGHLAYHCAPQLYGSVKFYSYATPTQLECTSVRSAPTRLRGLKGAPDLLKGRIKGRIRNKIKSSRYLWWNVLSMSTPERARQGVTRLEAAGTLTFFVWWKKSNRLRMISSYHCTHTYRTLQSSMLFLADGARGGVSKQKRRPDPFTALDRRARSCGRARDKVNFRHSRRAQEWATRNEYVSTRTRKGEEKGREEIYIPSSRRASEQKQNRCLTDGRFAKRCSKVPDKCLIIACERAYEFETRDRKKAWVCGAEVDGGLKVFERKRWSDPVTALERSVGPEATRARRGREKRREGKRREGNRPRANAERASRTAAPERTANAKTLSGRTVREAVFEGAR